MAENPCTIDFSLTENNWENSVFSSARNDFEQSLPSKKKNIFVFSTGWNQPSHRERSPVWVTIAARCIKPEAKTRPVALSGSSHTSWRPLLGRTPVSSNSCRRQTNQTQPSLNASFVYPQRISERNSGKAMSQQYVLLVLYRLFGYNCTIFT